MSEKKRLRIAHRSIERVLEQLATLIEIAEDEQLLSLRAPEISAWSVAEQIEHLRRSDLSILDALGRLETENPPAGSPTLAGRLVLATGFIPRGRGRAPSAVKPLDIQPGELPGQLRHVVERFTDITADLERLSASRATIRHPALGFFTASQMLAFAGIHHYHHLKIIRDIHRSAERRQR
jgi:hypothetical protein